MHITTFFSPIPCLVLLVLSLSRLALGTDFFPGKLHVVLILQSFRRASQDTFDHCGRRRILDPCVSGVSIIRHLHWLSQLLRDREVSPHTAKLTSRGLSLVGWFARSFFSETHASMHSGAPMENPLERSEHIASPEWLRMLLQPHKCPPFLALIVLAYANSTRCRCG